MSVEGPRPDTPGAPAGEGFPETADPPDDPAVGSAALPAEQLVGPEAAGGSDEDVTRASDDMEAEEGARTDV